MTVFFVLDLSLCPTFVDLVDFTDLADSTLEVSSLSETICWNAEMIASNASSPSGRLSAPIASFVWSLMSFLAASVAPSTSGKPYSG